ncbi:MAG: aldehyde dehydrogenase family protein, partial [Vicinamibacterales bacterium]
MLHLPILRWGRPYRSVGTVVAPHFRTREPFVAMSQANVGLIRRDLLHQAEARARLHAIPVSILVSMAKRAAEHFMHDTLPLDPESGSTQTPQQYVEQVTATTGMPWSNVRRNMAKVHGVLSKVDEVLSGLTRGLDLAVLDEGIGQAHGQMLSFFPRTDALGVVLPSNSPGVHTLWAPATALKMPLVLKPGSAEPWTPLRIIQSWVKAGVPSEAFAYYPTDHAGGTEILRSCGRGLVFGDVASTKRWKSDPRVEVHGPGYSKVVIGPDLADDWERFLDVIVESITNNGGRSCVNASGVWVTRHGDAIAEALADRVSRVVPRSADDPEAVLAPFADPDTARRISTTIDSEAEGARVFGGHRIASAHGGTYLLPIIVRCDADHALANREFL